MRIFVFWKEYKTMKYKKTEYLILNKFIGGEECPNR